MRVAQVLANYQTQTHALVIHLLHIFQFSKFLEKSFLICFANTDACVLYFDQDLAFFFYVRSIDLHKTVFACKLESILNQIDQDLLQAHLVAKNHFWDRLVDCVNQFFALNVRVAFKHQISLMHHFVKREFGLLQVEESLVNPGQVEKIIYKAKQKVDLKLNVAHDVLWSEALLQQALSEFFSVCLPRFIRKLLHQLQHVEELENDSQRCAHLMGHHLQYKFLLFESLVKNFDFIVDETLV